MTETIKAWHFVGDRLRDGRPIPKDGVWLRHEGQIRICVSGLHASLRPWDALLYAPGSVLCYVECRGDIHEHDDKLACRGRRILVRADMTETCRFFARMQALSVIHLWPSTPPDVVLDYLMAGDESLRRAARDAARDAAWAASRDAVWDAAWDASRDASRDAAWDAARATARDATSAAAWDAARATESAAAWGASWVAAWAAAGREFDALVCEQFGVAT